MSETLYIHGSSAPEQERLGVMNSLLNAGELELIGLRGGERVLELGAGTGIFARALAERLPRGSLVAVERDERQIAAARRMAQGLANVDLRRGDVLEPPLARDEWGSFDVVHARFLLEHLTRPLDAVRVMLRAARSGGRIVLLDDDHDTLRTWPELPGFQRLWRAYCELYTVRGLDPWIGRRLTGLLSEAGARVERCSMLFFGGCRGMPSFDALFDNLYGVVDGAARDVVEAGLLDADSVRAGLEELGSWRARADAALWYALPFAVGRREA